MSKIRQADIYPGAISFTKNSNFAITSTVAYAQSNLTKTAYAIGTVGGMAASDPLAIKEFNFSPSGDWADEQDWTAYNQSFTAVISVDSVNGGIVTPTASTNASISIGDLVGIYGAGTWSASGVLSIAKSNLASAGSQNAGLVAGGTTGGNTNATELFNGSSWSTSGTLSIVKSNLAGTGSQNAGLVAGGITGATRTNATELFNGSSWSTSGTLSIVKSDLASAGSQNAGLVAGGSTSGNTNATELFNGSSWSTSGTLSIAKANLASAGSQNACLEAGGLTAGATNATELFNGSSWSKSGTLITARYNMAAAGSQNAALMAGGTTTAVNNTTELFNGSTWSASGVLSVAKSGGAGGGSQSAGLMAGGVTAGARINNTELHNQTIYRKITTFANYKSAKNIGIAFDVTSLTLSVKFNGYIDNVNVTSSNSGITTAAQWVDKWIVLSRFSANQSITNNPSSIVSKTTVDADDLVVGRAISRTQMQVFSGNNFINDRIGGW